MASSNYFSYNNSQKAPIYGVFCDISQYIDVKLCNFPYVGTCICHALNGRIYNKKDSGGNLMKLNRNFLKGFSRAISLGSKRSTQITSPKKDVIMLRGDWENVGGYIRYGVEKYRAAEEYK